MTSRSPFGFLRLGGSCSDLSLWCWLGVGVFLLLDGLLRSVGFQNLMMIWKSYQEYHQTNELVPLWHVIARQLDSVRISEVSHTFATWCPPSSLEKTYSKFLKSHT